MSHPHRLFLLLALAVLTTAGAVQAQARTWGFARDTVYEWPSRGDSVLVTNSGSDTLRFDSLALEMARPADSRYNVSFEIPVPGAYDPRVILMYSTTQKSWAMPDVWKIDPGQNSLVKKFRGDSSLLVLNKKAVNQNDTVVFRMIFKASAGRGRDTLMFVSRQDATVALSPKALRLKRRVEVEALYDLRGRRMESLPQGARVPLRLVVTNGKN